LSGQHAQELAAAIDALHDAALAVARDVHELRLGEPVEERLPALAERGTRELGLGLVEGLAQRARRRGGDLIEQGTYPLQQAPRAGHAFLDAALRLGLQALAALVETAFALGG